MFACRDYRLQEDPSIEEQRRLVVARLGWVPRSHDRERSPNRQAERLEEEAREMEREARILEREPLRAPVNERTRRALTLQIEHLYRVIRRNRAAARRLRDATPPPTAKRRR